MEKADLIELMNYFPKRAEYPFAWAGHLPFAYFIAKELSPSVIVELGCHKGNSLCAFADGAKTAGSRSKIYGVDNWEGDPHSKKYSDEVFINLQRFVLEHYQNVLLIRSDFDKALENFQDESIDLLHIDGFHSYEAVKHDFESWLPKTKRTGMILLHDIAVEHSEFGVKKFWGEVTSKYQTLSFAHSNGLGIVLMDKAYEWPLVRDLLEDYRSDKLTFKLFEVKGTAVLRECEIASNEFKAHYIKNIKPVHIAENKSLKTLLKLVLIKLGNSVLKK